MKVLDIEKIIGIETFYTLFRGIGGKLRTKPEDFIVSEVSNYPSKKEDGKFAIADVTSVNWETNILVRELSNWLHISRQRIGFAGTKDKRAMTTQLMSFYNIPKQKLSEIKIHNVKIDNIYYSNHPVKIGNLLGNQFEIIVRNINDDSNLEQGQKIASFIEDNNGFPNFFGIQRFGIIRPITHIVGKYIVKNDFEKAVMTYIANPIKGEDEESYELRKNLQETYDFSEALKKYPNNLNFEKAILNKLVQNPKDFIGALKELPKNLLSMFVYAYQSYLFNKILSERIRQKIPINQAIIGDLILPIRKGIFNETPIPVSEKNIKKVNYQISKGNAVVSGVLFGSDSVFCDGEIGEIEHKIIKKENFDPRDFIICDIPFISSSGSRRPIFAKIKDLNFELIEDELDTNKKAVNIKFELKKGSYATSLLREFMKTDNIRNY
jgi:tRNA pseudouridine13 synthase